MTGNSLRRSRAPPPPSPKCWVGPEAMVSSEVGPGLCLLREHSTEAAPALSLAVLCCLSGLSPPVKKTEVDSPPQKDSPRLAAFTQPHRPIIAVRSGQSTHPQTHSPAAAWSRYSCTSCVVSLPACSPPLSRSVSESPPLPISLFLISTILPPRSHPLPSSPGPGPPQRPGSISL